LVRAGQGGVAVIFGFQRNFLGSQCMANSDDILRVAQQRAREMGLPYAGALLPDEAYALLQRQPGAKVVDVRSRAELDFVGRIPGSVEIEWKTYPGMAPNPNFVQQLMEKVPQDAVVMFVCRSGARSHDAANAAKQAGYGAAFNLLEGFEGDRDASGHRNTIGGWRAAGLPWVQS
jgi:rhodanese-related sulfurtransferase